MKVITLAMFVVAAFTLTACSWFVPAAERVVEDVEMGEKDRVSQVAK